MVYKKQEPLLYIQSTVNVNETNHDLFLYNSRDVKKQDKSLDIIDEQINNRGRESLIFYLTNGQNIIGIPIKKTALDIVIIKPNQETNTICISNIEKVMKEPPYEISNK